MDTQMHSSRKRKNRRGEGGYTYGLFFGGKEAKFSLM